MGIRNAVVTGCAAACVFVALPASAQEAVPPAAAQPPAAEMPATGGARTHDGFYLGVTLGPGYYSVSPDVPGDVSISGMTLSSSLILGGSLMDGLVLGGGFFGDYASSPTWKVGGQEAQFEDLTQTLVGLGLFVDFYPDPHDGLHFQGMIGWGGLETSYKGSSGGSDPTGLEILIGGGYDFWVSDEWSIGPMARLVYAPLKLDGVAYNTIAPALLANFVYH